MENASKALIIAGSILIAIILITIGIAIVSSTKGTVESGKQGMQTQEIIDFNSKFIPYEGAKRGSELRGIVSLVNANNAIDNVHKVALYAPVASISLLVSNKIYNVELMYSNGSTPTTPGGTLLAGTPSASEEGYINIIKITE